VEVNDVSYGYHTKLMRSLRGKFQTFVS